MTNFFSLKHLKFNCVETMNMNTTLILNKLLGGIRARRRSGRNGHVSPEVLEVRSLMTASSLIASATHTNSTHVTPRIINGTVTGQFPSVGLVGDASDFGCSGTLIAPQFVLTAGHCGVGVGQTAGRFRTGSATYSTSRVFVHPGYNENALGTDNANDIAIYQLDRPVSGVTPSQIFRSTPVAGQLLTLVGFGGAGTGASGGDGSYGTKRVGTTPIDEVTARIIAWNFDNETESNTAPGDSGGPAFVTVGGVQYLAGVTSGGDKANSGIGDYSFDTRVDAYAAWIDSIVGSTATQSLVSVKASDASAAETVVGQSPNPGTFVITRTGAVTSPLIINVSMSGTAKNGTDYNSIPTIVTIPAGATSATVSLNVKDDAIAEGTETATLTILTGSGYGTAAGNGTVSISIADNDGIVTSNDLFANRRQLSGAAVNVTGTNVGAKSEAGEPNILNVSGGKSVWWTWTASISGMVNISTVGSNFDTTVGIYRGTAVRSLALVAANDDADGSNGIYTSQVSFAAVAGQVYQIMVDGYDGDAGNIRLTLDQPAGRKFTSAGQSRVAAARPLDSATASSAIIHGHRHQHSVAARREVPRPNPRGEQHRHLQPATSLVTSSAESESAQDSVFGHCVGELLDRVR